LKSLFQLFPAVGLTRARALPEVTSSAKQSVTEARGRVSFTAWQILHFFFQEIRISLSRLSIRREEGEKCRGASCRIFRKLGLQEHVQESVRKPPQRKFEFDIIIQKNMTFFLLLQLET